MLISAHHLINTPVLSMQDGGAVGRITESIIDPNTLKIIAFRTEGPAIHRNFNILVASSIREYSSLGAVIDSTDELVAPNDVVKIAEILELNFSLIDLTVETKKGSKLGKIIDYTVTSDNFAIQQLIVKRPIVKGFLDPELTIHRNEIVEINDYKVIVKDEEKIIKKNAEKEEFVPNFVNPFREKQPGFAPADTKTPADKDTE